MNRRLRALLAILANAGAVHALRLSDVIVDENDPALNEGGTSASTQPDLAAAPIHGMLNESLLQRFTSNSQTANCTATAYEELMVKVSWCMESYGVEHLPKTFPIVRTCVEYFEQQVIADLNACPETLCVWPCIHTYVESKGHLSREQFSRSRLCLYKCLLSPGTYLGTPILLSDHFWGALIFLAELVHYRESGSTEYDCSDAIWGPRLAVEILHFMRLAMKRQEINPDENHAKLREYAEGFIWRWSVKDDRQCKYPEFVLDAGYAGSPWNGVLITRINSLKALNDRFNHHNLVRHSTQDIIGFMNGIRQRDYSYTDDEHRLDMMGPAALSTHRIGPDLPSSTWYGSRDGALIFDGEYSTGLGGAIGAASDIMTINSISREAARIAADHNIRKCCFLDREPKCTSKPFIVTDLTDDVMVKQNLRTGQDNCWSRVGRGEGWDQLVAFTDKSSSGQYKEIWFPWVGKHPLCLEIHLQNIVKSKVAQIQSMRMSGNHYAPQMLAFISQQSNDAKDGFMDAVPWVVASVKLLAQKWDLQNKCGEVSLLNLWFAQHLEQDKWNTDIKKICMEVHRQNLQNILHTEINAGEIQNAIDCLIPDAPPAISPRAAM